MKQSLHLSVLFFFILLVSSTKISARFILTKQVFAGQEERKLKEILPSQDSLQVMVEEDIESIKELMGMEACDDDNGDREECLKRRVTSEAHLDYIYTQHHDKP